MKALWILLLTSFLVTSCGTGSRKNRTQNYGYLNLEKRNDEMITLETLETIEEVSEDEEESLNQELQALIPEEKEDSEELTTFDEADLRDRALATDEGELEGELEGEESTTQLAEVNVTDESIDEDLGKELIDDQSPITQEKTAISKRVATGTSPQKTETIDKEQTPSFAKYTKGEVPFITSKERKVFKSKVIINRDKSLDGKTSSFFEYRDVGPTYLIFNAKYGSLKVVKYLVKRGLDINYQDRRGNTPLIVASMNGRHEIVRYLLESGANRMLKNKKGLSAIDVVNVNKKGKNKIIQLLSQ
jgi:hypothetical protein